MFRRNDPYFILFLLLIAGFVGLSLASTFLIPLGEAADEVSHYGYIDALVLTRALPRPEGAAFGAAHHPPLYYTLAALATAWVPRTGLDVTANPDFAFGNPETPNLLLHTRKEGFPYQGDTLAWHLARLLSIGMGSVTILATWLTARLLIKDERIALGAAAFVAFLPGFISSSAVINNDNLITMLSAIVILQTVRYLQGEQSWKRAVVLGILLGAAAITKLSGLTLWLFVGCIFGWLLWRNKLQASLLRHAFITFAIAGAIAAPFFIYNQLTWGDPLGWAFILQVTPQRQGTMSLEDWSVLSSTLYTSFWGRFGGALHLPLPDWIYILFGILALCAVAGWFLLAVDARKGRLDPGTRQAFALFALFWALMLAAFVRWTTTVAGTDHARQLFPGLSLLAIALTAGFARLFGGRVRLAMIAWSAGFLFSALVFVWTVGTTFSSTPSAPITTPTAQNPRIFGDTLELMTFQTSPEPLFPGDLVRVKTQWRALTAPHENYWLFLQLQKDGEGVSHKEGVPGAGRVTTDWWEPNQVFSSTHNVTVPEDAEPGKYSLILGVHPFQRWEWLPVEGREMTTLAEFEIMTR